MDDGRKEGWMDDRWMNRLRDKWMEDNFGDKDPFSLRAAHH